MDKKKETKQWEKKKDNCSQVNSIIMLIVNSMCIWSVQSSSSLIKGVTNHNREKKPFTEKKSINIP